MLDIDHPSDRAKSHDKTRLLTGAVPFCAIGAYYVYKLRWINPLPDGTAAAATCSIFEIRPRLLRRPCPPEPRSEPANG
jgi:hypothetical protein